MNPDAPDAPIPLKLNVQSSVGIETRVEKPGARGNPDILPNPKPGFGSPAGFGFAFLPQECCV